jgi:hypothetical protein
MNGQYERFTTRRHCRHRCRSPRPRSCTRAARPNNLARAGADSSTIACVKEHIDREIIIVIIIDVVYAFIYSCNASK